jgi:hypothetical protein
VPPTAAHFLGQRVRQAYDGHAQRCRMVTELAVLPCVATALASRRRGAVRAVVVGLAAAVGLAELGRRRSGGRAVWPATAALWAVPWLAERSVCVWLALAARSRGGVRYAGGRLRRAATPPRRLAEEVPARSPLDERPARYSTGRPPVTSIRAPEM